MANEKNQTTSNRVNGNTKGKEKKESKLRLEWDTVPFPENDKRANMRARTLAAEISERFKSVFADYAGTNILFNGKNFTVQLVFEKGAGNGKIENLIDYANNTGFNTRNAYSVHNYIDRKFSGRMFDINEETKELVSEIMFGGPDAKHDWEKLIKENRMSNAQTMIGVNNFYAPKSERILLMIDGGIDLNRVLTKMYGNTQAFGQTKNEIGEVFNKVSKVRYKASLSKYLPDGDMSINIDCFDPEAVKKTLLDQNPVQPKFNGWIYY